MNLQMIRAERLVNAQQRGMPNTEFIESLSDAGRMAAFDEWLRRRGARPWLAALDPSLRLVMLLDPRTTAAIASSAEAMAAIASSAEAMAAIASSAEAMAAVLSSSISVSAIFAAPSAKAAIMASTALAAASVPAMTGATTPSGVASASSSAGAGYLPWLAFDRAPGTFWNSAVVASGTGSDWIQYSFPTDVFIASMTLTPAGSAIYAPKECAIQYSSDGITFTSAKSISAAASGAQSFEVMTPGFYKHWRLVMYSAHGGLTYLQIAELSFTGFAKP